jgi:hypothetical protein
MLIDMMNDVEHKAGDATPSPEPRRLAAADKDVVQQFLASADPARDRRSRGGGTAGIAPAAGRATRPNSSPPFSFMASLVPLAFGPRT